MDLKLEKEMLENELKKINKVIKPTSSSEFMKCVKFELKNRNLYLTAMSDVLSSIIVIKDIECDENYSTLLNSQILLDSVSKLKSKDVEIKSHENLIEIKGGKRKFNINTIDVSNYPKNTKSNTDKKISISKNHLLKGIKTTIGMVSKVQNRPVLTAINVSGKKDTNIVKFVSTDSYRLAKIDIELNDSLSNDFSMNIPSDFANYMYKVLKDSDQENIDLYYSEREIKVALGNQMIKSRFIDGNFPNIERLIKFEDNDDNTLLLSKELLEDTISCAVFKNDADYFLEFKLKPNKLIVSNSNQELGRFEESLSDVECNVENLKLSLNAKYIKEALATIDSEKVKFKFGDTSLKPIFMFGFEKVDDNLLQLALPIRTY